MGIIWTIGAYNMALKIIDKSEVIEGKRLGKKPEKKIEKEGENDGGKVGEKGQECVCPVVATKKLNIISADKIIQCERRDLGMTNSCALCEGVNIEMFKRCKNKWTEY